MSQRSLERVIVFASDLELVAAVNMELSMKGIPHVIITDAPRDIASGVEWELPSASFGEVRFVEKIDEKIIEHDRS